MHKDDAAEKVVSHSSSSRLDTVRLWMSGFFLLCAVLTLGATVEMIEATSRTGRFLGVRGGACLLFFTAVNFGFFCKVFVSGVGPFVRGGFATWKWSLFPLGFGIALSAWVTLWPMHGRFALSQSAFETVAHGVLDGSHKNMGVQDIGWYRVQGIEIRGVRGDTDVEFFTGYNWEFEPFGFRRVERPSGVDERDWDRLGVGWVAFRR